MKFLTAIILSLLLSACAGHAVITETDLQHHHWRLIAINGEALPTGVESDLEIGEQMTINGLAGCNHFFGSAKLQQGQLLAEPLGATKMACPPAQARVESAVLKTLNEGAAITLGDQTLTLKGSQYRLSYQLEDWK